MDADGDRAHRDATVLLAGVREAVVRHRLLAARDHVLVAVSGGSDSVALLHALTRLRTEYRLALSVCHVHHGLRPEADRDAEFVETLAARLACPVTVERVTVHRSGGSPEGQARAARYRALRRVLGTVGATRLALGHTADDQAETVLMRVLEGAGPRGLAGIPVRRGPLIRPLLEVDRRTVLDHLAVSGLSFVEDATNHDRKLLRNRIRHDVLPLLAANGWPRIAEALRRTARACREEVEALDAWLAPTAAGLLEVDPVGWRVSLAALRSLPPGAVKTVFRHALAEVPGGELRAGLRAAHLGALEALLGAPVGARVRLPGGVVVERARAAIWIGSGLPAGVGAGAAPPIPLAVPGETAVGHLRLTTELDGPAPRRDRDPIWEVGFDADAVPAELAVRAQRTGDRLVPFGGDRPVRVSGLLAAAGIPRAARGAWPLVVAGRAAGAEILWVIGVRRASIAPVRPDTARVLRVRAVLDRPGADRGDLT